MLALNGLTIDRFLPLRRMRDMAASAHAEYLNADPFPHVVFDNFFDDSLIDEVLAEFPKPGSIRWQEFDNAHEVKLASAAEGSFGPANAVADVSPELHHFPGVSERGDRHTESDP